MTRLERFAERLTQEMLEAYESDSSADLGARWGDMNAARLVAERLVREFAREIWGAQDFTRAETADDYLDEPEKP